MADVFMNKFVFTNSKDGFNLTKLIKQTMLDCGVTLDCPCDDCEGAQAQAQVQIEALASTSAPTSELIAFAIESQAKDLKAALSRIEQLEAQIQALTNDNSASI